MLLYANILILLFNSNKNTFKRKFSKNYSKRFCEAGMDFNSVIKTLKTFAPLDLAESWDNVGILVEPPQMG